MAPRWRTLLLLSCVALAACASARRRVDGDLVAGIRFEGREGGVQGVQLRSAMAQKATGPAARLPVLGSFVPPIAFNRGLLSEDGKRLETWFAHHGWFDARVLGWRVETLRVRRYRRDGSLRKGGVVRVVGTLDQGLVSRLRPLQIVFEDELADRYWRSAQVATIRREGWVQEGAPFVLSNVDYTRDQLLRNIRDLGYAYATVDASVEAWPDEHQAEVTLRVRTGPPTKRARAELDYDGRVRESDIREVLALDEPAGFRQTELTRARDRLIGLGTFAVVRVEPDLSDPTRDEVPVTVTLTDGRFGALRGGVGAVYNGVTVTPRVSTTVKHSNLDRHLARFEGGASLGAGIPIVGSWVATRMLGGVNVGVIRPRTFGDRVDTNAELSFRRDLLAGQLLFARSRALAGLSWRFTDHVVLNVGPSVEFNRLGSGSPFGGEASLGDEDRLLATATFGDGRKNPFVLALAEARLSIDWRTGADGQDAGVDPRGGYYYVVGVRQAVPFRRDGPSSFRFTDIYGEARLYRSVLSADRSRVPFTLAMRVRGKWLPSLAGRDLLSAVPYADRAFLGGSLDMRGFRINQVGAYDCVCLSREEELTRGLVWPFVSGTGVSRLRPNPIYLPRGGRASGLVSGELRWRTTSSWGLAIFGDLGALVSSIDELARVAPVLRWDAGIGYRQSTPVGPIRIDLALRPSYPEDLGPIRPGEPGAGQTAFRGDVFGCEPFPDARLTRRVPGLGISPRWNGALPPVIVNLTIAIGEAI